MADESYNELIQNMAFLSKFRYDTTLSPYEQIALSKLRTQQYMKAHQKQREEDDDDTEINVTIKEVIK